MDSHADSVAAAEAAAETMVPANAEVPMVAAEGAAVKGFDTDLIRERADKEIHPILGETFRLDVHSVSDEVLHATVEKRLTELENECLQRRAQSAAAGSMPELDLLLAAEPVERKRKGGALSNEEKEALKRQRKQEKKLEGERKAATAAAVKVLPALKDIKKKLEDKVGKLGEAMEQVPMASHEAVANAQEKLTSTVDSCSKLIEAAATGKAVPAVQLLSHKDLQAVSKQGAAALRSLNDFVRGQKENSNPNAGNGRGKGKKSDCQLHDLGHGPVELLREVVGYIELSDDVPDLRQSLAAVQATLLLVRALLLGWDCPRFKEHMFEPPMPKLAKHWPNRQWQCKHPSKGTALREVQSCRKFMAENDPVFQEEPWLWLFDTLNGMELVLQLVLQSN
ncbi:unnamed protein product [Cladocopium goreaui]|uniref:Uncharacterized protein n=1 Tax=Cladocopium goreaui TaxID=2562237 RepID=A0A9P1GC97_9DINO|nr:unnamed protein product [Cladocopium goreaui]